MKAIASDARNESAGPRWLWSQSRYDRRPQDRNALADADIDTEMSVDAQGLVGIVTTRHNEVAVEEVNADSTTHVELDRIERHASHDVDTEQQVAARVAVPVAQLRLEIASEAGAACAPMGMPVPKRNPEIQHQVLLNVIIADHEAALNKVIPQLDQAEAEADGPVSLLVILFV